MVEEETWQDKCYKDDKNTWIMAQHVRKIQAPCGCRLNVWADDVPANPQLDTSRCRVSTQLLQEEAIKISLDTIKRLKAEVAEA